MTVSRALKMKGGQDVHTITPDATIADAVAELGARRIGALVVSSDGSHPDGILSERDIVRELGRQGAEILSRPVSDLMTREVKTCTPGDAANDAIRTMSESRFRHMPVLQDGALVGVISMGDVVKMRLSELQNERDAMEAMIAGHA
ncbi:MAG: CBS domain-containing protein [Pseudomonadota bacterium]